MINCSKASRAALYEMRKGCILLTIATIVLFVKSCTTACQIGDVEVTVATIAPDVPVPLVKLGPIVVKLDPL